MQHVLIAGGEDSRGLVGWLAVGALPTGWLAVRTLLVWVLELVAKYIDVSPFAQKVVRMLALMSARQLLIPH